MKTELSNELISLKHLTLTDSTEFHNLYFPKNKLEDKQNNLTTGTKTPVEFTEHIISQCNYIFTIRTIDNPNRIIGDCALHHLNQEKSEIEIGGTLIPEFWGKGIMLSAFNLLIAFAKQKYSIERMVAKTENTNHKALKFAEKIGFKKIDTNGENTTLEKRII